MEHSESSSDKSTPRLKKILTSITAMILGMLIALIVIGGAGFLGGMYLGYGDQMWEMIPAVINPNFW